MFVHYHKNFLGCYKCIVKLEPQNGVNVLIKKLVACHCNFYVVDNISAFLTHIVDDNISDYANKNWLFIMFVSMSLLGPSKVLIL